MKRDNIADLDGGCLFFPRFFLRATPQELEQRRPQTLAGVLSL